MDLMLKNDVPLKYFKAKKIKIDMGLLEKRRSVHESHFDNNKIIQVIKNDYCAFVFKGSDLGKPNISCRLKWGNKLSNKNIDDLLLKMASLDRRIKTREFYVPYNSAIYKKLLSKGYELTGIELYAKVSESLACLEDLKKDLKKDFKKDNKNQNIKVVTMTNRDRKKLIDLEILAHRNSKTSRVKKLKRSMFIHFYNKICNPKTTLVAKIGNKPVGVISHSKNNFGLGHIMTIAVHPNYQGIGVAKSLYQACLKSMKESGIVVYTGVSTTTEVLELAKKLKREAVNCYLSSAI